jgi:hypothetical protein
MNAHLEKDGRKTTLIRFDLLVYREPRLSVRFGRTKACELVYIRRFRAHINELDGLQNDHES